MERQIAKSNEFQVPPKKREYRQPVLHRYGDVGDLTKGVGPGIGTDNNPGPLKT